MASGILGIGLTGLNAAQAGIRTTEHNIANVNTVGYRRQEVGYAANTPEYTGMGYFGTGVGVETVRRLYSQFLDNEVMLNQAQLSRHETYAAQASQVDSLLGNSGSGLSTALDSFFAAVNELANDPTSNATRQNLLSSADNLVGRVNTLGEKLQSYLSTSNNQIDAIASQVTVLANQVANLNVSIGRAEGVNGQPANDLRDQRDQVLSELNELVNVSTFQQPDGSLNVFIGSGQALVIGGTASRMTTALDPEDSSLRVPTLDLNGVSLTLDATSITGGQLGGLLAARQEVVLPALRDLGRIAIGIADQFNTVHAAGYALDGVTTGVNFFATAAGMLNQPAGHASNGGTGVISATLTSTDQLTSSAYQLSYDGANYTLTRLSDGASRTGTLAQVTDLDNDAVNDQGFTLALAGAPVAGDTWSIHLTQTGAAMFAKNPVITAPSQIAAAQLINSPGDNANALAMAALQFNQGLNNGTATFTAAYNQTISRTATLASEADWSRDAFTTLVAEAETAQKGVSGVNLDEEAVNLIRFQQAYQASAKAIQVAASLFDELLGIVR